MAEIHGASKARGLACPSGILDAKTTHASTEHLLLGICQEPESIAFQILLSTGIEVTSLEEAARQAIQAGNADPELPRSLSTDGKRVIDRAYREAITLNNDYIGTEHLLLSLLQVNAQAARILCNCGVDLESVRTAINRLHGH